MDRFKVLGTEGKYTIPWVVIAPHEGQAVKNHSQSLQTLNRRGGLSWCEMCAVLQDRKWMRMDENLARKEVERIVSETICTVQMVECNGHYVPKDFCTMTNPTTSGGVSVADDVKPCTVDCTNDCDNCIIQKIFDEYAEITRQVN